MGAKYIYTFLVVIVLLLACNSEQASIEQNKNNCNLIFEDIVQFEDYVLDSTNTKLLDKKNDVSNEFFLYKNKEKVANSILITIEQVSCCECDLEINDALFVKNLDYEAVIYGNVFEKISKDSCCSNVFYRSFDGDFNWRMIFVTDKAKKVLWATGDSIEISRLYSKYND